MTKHKKNSSQTNIQYVIKVDSSKNNQHINQVIEQEQKLNHTLQQDEQLNSKEDFNLQQDLIYDESIKNLNFNDQQINLEDNSIDQLQINECSFQNDLDQKQNIQQNEQSQEQYLNIQLQNRTKNQGITSKYDLKTQKSYSNKIISKYRQLDHQTEKTDFVHQKLLDVYQRNEIINSYISSIMNSNQSSQYLSLNKPPKVQNQPLLSLQFEKNEKSQNIELFNLLQNIKMPVMESDNFWPIQKHKKSQSEIISRQLLQIQSLEIKQKSETEMKQSWYQQIMSESQNNQENNHEKTQSIYVQNQVDNQKSIDHVNLQMIEKGQNIISSNESNKLIKQNLRKELVHNFEDFKSSRNLIKRQEVLQDNQIEQQIYQFKLDRKKLLSENLQKRIDLQYFQKSSQKLSQTHLIKQNFSLEQLMPKQQVKSLIRQFNLSQSITNLKKNVQVKEIVKSYQLDNSKSSLKDYKPLEKIQENIKKHIKQIEPVLNNENKKIEFHNLLDSKFQSSKPQYENCLINKNHLLLKLKMKIKNIKSN